MPSSPANGTASDVGGAVYTFTRPARITRRWARWASVSGGDRAQRAFPTSVIDIAETPSCGIQELATAALNNLPDIMNNGWLSMVRSRICFMGKIIPPPN